MFNDDGWVEFFGRARPIGVLPWHLALTNAFGDTPGDQDLFVSDNLGAGFVRNSFPANGDKRIGFVAALPLELDTSCPVRLRLSWLPDDNDTGDIRWVVRWGYTSDGSNIYRSTAAAPTTGPNEQSAIELVQGSNGTADQQVSHQIKLDVSDQVARRENGYGDVLWVVIERTGTHVDDDYTGDVDLIAVTPLYNRWCLGGHLRN
jgi:hypothetical protein